MAAPMDDDLVSADCAADSEFHPWLCKQLLEELKSKKKKKKKKGLDVGLGIGPVDVCMLLLNFL